METDINISPQDKAASCGLRKCKECGKVFVLKKKVQRYCGRKCGAQFRVTKFKIVCSVCGKDKTVHGYQKNAKYCSWACSYIAKIKVRDKPKWKEYKEKHPEVIRRSAMLYRVRHKREEREGSLLYATYGTRKNIPEVCKRVVAIKRVLRMGNLTPDIISSISEGRTHEAYI